VLGRTDAVVFTGGIGENAAAIRTAACDRLEDWGIVLDPEKNRQTVGRKEGPITKLESRVQVLVIPTDEERAIAVDTYELASERVNESGTDE